MRVDRDHLFRDGKDIWRHETARSSIDDFVGSAVIGLSEAPHQLGFSRTPTNPPAVCAQCTDNCAHDHRCKEDGLTNAEADRRREIFGPNKLESKETSAILQFLSCVLLASPLPCLP